jgi:hypothetical protein
MNQYRCETCNFFDKTTRYCNVGNFYTFDRDVWINTLVGCASHSDFQNQREKDAREHGWFTDWEMQQAELKGYNQGNNDGMGYGRKSEREKVLDELEYYLSETAFQYGILSNVVVNLMQKKMEELRGEQE